MSDMFRNYPQPDDYKPDNYPRPFKKWELVIMSGETASHTFEIPFDVETSTNDYDILYKLGINLVLTKNKNVCETIYDEKKHRTFITCKLLPSDTLLFKNTSLQAQVQIRFKMKDSSVIYTEVYDIKLLNSLDAAEVKPSPYVITGFGYTID